MVQHVLMISLVLAIAAISILTTAKVMLFLRQRHRQYYHPMCLLYFPGLDIMFTSNRKEKRDKQIQNRFTKQILFLLLYILLVTNFLG